MLYDNRRQIIEPNGFEGFDLSKNIFDSTPLVSSTECAKIRYLSKLTYILPYNKNTSFRSGKVYKSYLVVGVRNFIKGYYSTEPCFGLKGTEFKRVNDLISFIYDFYSTKGIKVSNSSISNLKKRKIIIKPVPNTKENVEFAHYVKVKIPQFDEGLFLKNQ